MIDWFESHGALLTILAIGSAIAFVGTLLALPFIAAAIPRDYFAHERRPRSAWADRPRIVRYSALAAKNALGGVLVLAGVAMLVAPGQGLLTILVGLMLLNFPGKFRLERRLVSSPRVRRALDWLRRKRGAPPLDPPGEAPRPAG